MLFFFLYLYVFKKWNDSECYGVFSMDMTLFCVAILFQSPYSADKVRGLLSRIGGFRVFWEWGVPLPKSFQFPTGVRLPPQNKVISIEKTA